jgi:signal peptidase II
MKNTTPIRASNILLVTLITLATIAADQISKQIALRAFQPGEIKPIINGFFNLTLTFNRGAAFGLWSGLPSGWRQAVLGLTVLLALVIVLFLITRPYYQTPLAQISLAAILGGAIGNVIDRLSYGAVVDFLDFYIGNTHWPAFNIADSAICVGVALLLFLPKPQEGLSQASQPSEHPR